MARGLAQGTGATVNTRRLKKRDRAWAKGMVLWWHCTALGRNHSTERRTRLRIADAAQTWLAHQDIDQQEALSKQAGC